MRKTAVVAISILLAGCANVLVKQEDLDAWVNVPVVALDTHSLFITVPMVRTITDSGVEVRNYVNKQGVSNCFGHVGGTGQATTKASGTGQTVGGYSTVRGNAYTMSSVNYTAFQNCSSGMVGCDNIFYIRDGKVIEYRPTGRCYTNASVRPQPGWERFAK